MLARVDRGGRLRHLGGLGVVQMRAGGNVSDYIFDPNTGLSHDPRLAFDLQDLTPAQLQTALSNPAGVTADLISLLNQAATGTGAGALPCGAAGGNDPTCGPVGSPLSSLNPFSGIGGGGGGLGSSALLWVLLGGSMLVFMFSAVKR